jgi:membrane associated rhomboid family serine protease
MFIPLGDDNTTVRITPFIVWLLIALNVYGWVLELSQGESFLASYAAVPFELSSGIDLIKPTVVSFAGKRLEIPQAPGPHPIYITLLTSMFLHGSWMHIIGNMVYLFIFGDQIETRFGHLRFLFFYLLAGVVAGLAQVWADPHSYFPCVGASGAIAGVLGAYLILYPHNSVRVLLYNSIVLMPALIVLGLWGVMQVIGQMGAPGEHGGVAYMAHLGGFGVGIVIGTLVRLMGRDSERSIRRRR